MRLIERIRNQVAILRRARQAAEAGKSMEEFQADEIEVAERDGNPAIIQLIIALLPLIIAIFEQWRNR